VLTMGSSIIPLAPYIAAPDLHQYEVLGAAGGLQ
jgi:hypothetical protein